MALPRAIGNSGPREKTIAEQQERSDLAEAENHGVGRNRAVAKVFCYISVMRAASCIPDGSKAGITHPDLAVPQDFQATGGNQAAHVLPGCLSLQDGTKSRRRKALWEYAPNPEIRKEILSLFEATHDLPAAFNKADTAAEIRRALGSPGLKQVFHECSQYILDEFPPKLNSGERIVVVDRPVVSNAYRLWVQGSLAAYRVAGFGKSRRIHANRPSDVRDNPRVGAIGPEWALHDLDARQRDFGRTVHGAKGTVWEFMSQESYLRAYARVTTETLPLAEFVINEIERPFGKKLPEGITQGYF